MRPAIVTGGRDVIPTPAMLAAFQQLLMQEQIDIIFTGEHPRGVDAHIKKWCRMRGFPHAGFDPWWNPLGSIAGPKRNGWMVQIAAQCNGIVIRFPGGKGTADCAQQAATLKIPVFSVTGEVTP